MNTACIVSLDRLFARMLELELKETGISIKTVTEKLNPPALRLAIDSAEVLIWDGTYYDGDLSFVKDHGAKTVVFSHTPIENQPKNVVAFYEKPFLVSDFVHQTAGLLGLKKSVSSYYSTTADFDITLNAYSKQAEINGEYIKFSPKEFSLLSLLCKNRGRLVTRNEVLETIWGSDYDPQNNADNVYINYLRNKIDNRFGVKLIYTVRGKGYMLK